MRKFFAVIGGGLGAVGVLGVSAVLLTAGYYIQQNRNAEKLAAVQKAVVAEPSAPQAVNPDTQTAADLPETAASEAPLSEETVGKAPEMMTAAPAFDEVRREADGMTVIAGRAAPGSTVSVLQNGVEIARSSVDRSGKFATLAMIPPDGLGHSLTLSQETDSGPRASEGEILLAPLAAPVEVAAVEVPEEDIAKVPEVAEVAATEEIAETSSEGVAAALSEEAAEKLDESLAEAAAKLEAAEESVETAQATLTPRGADLSEQQPQVDDVATASLSPLVEAAESPQGIAEEEQVVAALDEAPQAPQEPAVLRSTATGIELLNPRAPEAMKNVSIDTISYSETGDVQLAGRAQKNAVSVQVYLNNRSVISLPVDAEGRWRGDVPDVDEGIYTLRIDEVSGDGRVSSRVETPFKREDPLVLAAASAAEDGPIKAITVQKGATLWAIARDRYGEGELYVRVFEANKSSIRDPDLIYPGQIFELPQ